MEAVAEPHPLGGFRGLIGEEGREHGDHENKHRTFVADEQVIS
jgi:hypothetical protein